jgi:hypothetical protein
VFHVDRCLGRDVGNRLRKAGLLIRHHDEHFNDDSPDEAWIPVVSQQ